MTDLMERVGCGVTDLDEIAAAAVPPTVEEIEARTIAMADRAITVEREREIFACGAASVASFFAFHELELEVAA
jgi:hypothetical protein